MFVMSIHCVRQLTNSHEDENSLHEYTPLPAAHIAREMDFLPGNVHRSSKPIHTVKHLLHEPAPQAGNFFHVWKLVWIGEHNLRWTQTTVKKQKGQTLFSYIRKQRSEQFPDVALL